MSNDPLLQPYQLKHLTLRNRIMTTSHEPAYPEDGLPKERYAAYHAERAKAGVALTMTAGSASVSKDSPPSFNNICMLVGDFGEFSVQFSIGTERETQENRGNHHKFSNHLIILQKYEFSLSF